MLVPLVLWGSTNHMARAAVGDKTGIASHVYPGSGYSDYYPLPVCGVKRPSVSTRVRVVNYHPVSDGKQSRIQSRVLVACLTIDRPSDGELLYQPRSLCPEAQAFLP